MEIEVLDKAGLELYDNEIKAWVTEAIASQLKYKIWELSDDKITEHNNSSTAHNDIRELINNIEIDPKQYLTRNTTDGSITLTIIED